MSSCGAPGRIASWAQSPERLLVPLDMAGESERAVRAAADLAGSLGAAICLFSWSLDTGEAELARTYLAEIAAQMSVPATAHVAARPDGSAAPSIVAAAEALDATVVMASHGRSGIGQGVLGSVAEDVVRRAHRPVVLVGPYVDAGPPSGPVLMACVDASAFGRVVLPVAESWAKALSLPLHLVHVLQPGMSHGATELPSDGSASDYLERLAGTVRGTGDTQFELLHGDPARAIADYSRRIASLIAVATHARDGRDRVLGSVAMAIVHRSRRPVLVVQSGPAGTTKDR